MLREYVKAEEAADPTPSRASGMTLQKLSPNRAAAVSAIPEWLALLGAAGATLGRVLVATVLGTLWALPVGLAIGLSPRLTRMLQPVVQAMRKDLLTETYLQADETTVPVQMHDGRGSNHQAYLWQYGKPGGETVFDFCLIFADIC